MVGRSPIPVPSRRDPDEDEHREQFKRKPSEHEGQPDQRLPGARQAETPPLQRGCSSDVIRRRRRIGHGQRLHWGTRCLRKPRFQKRHRPLDEAKDQPLGGKSADEHQRQFPRDIEQLMIGGRIVGGSHEPVIERRKCVSVRAKSATSREISPTCSDTESRSCAPRLSDVSGIADFCSGAAACGGCEALAIARSVSMICARFLSSESVSSARFA